MRITEYALHLDGDRKPSLVKENSHNYPDLRQLDTPEKIRRMMSDVFHAESLAEEHMWAIALDTKCVPVGVFEISHGTVNSSLINPREVLIRLLLCGAVGFILVHNHPSGDVIPSKDDQDTTQKIKEAGKAIGISLWDHIVIGDGYYSFREENCL